MHPDRINAVDPREILKAAYAALSGAQRHAPNHQLLGAAVLFVTYCQRLGLDARALLEKAERIKKDADVAFGYHVRALENYIDGEISGK